MFKRVEKRRRKKEEEEELGLDEDMKQVLGMNDTDSEESASDSDDSESDDAEGSGHEEVLDSDEEERVFEQVEEEDSGDEASPPVITVQEALCDPVYVISLEPSVKGCILCSGKILKGPKTIELHRTSKAWKALLICSALQTHQRRSQQFAALASGVNSETNAWDLVAQQEAERRAKHPLRAPSEMSNREQKRISRAALRKTRRKNQKVKAKANKAAAKESSAAPAKKTASPVTENTEPPKKKHKSNGLTSSPPFAVESRKKEVKSIAAIARSASDRARAARAKATKVDANQT